MGMVVETRDWGHERRWSAWGIDDWRPALQLHMPIMQKTNHLGGYLKIRRPTIEHPVPNAQLHNKSQKRFEDTRDKN